MSDSPSLKVIEGKSYATSLDVAKHFHKRHDHVLRDIQQLITDAPQDFSLPNFGESTYQNSRGQSYPMYLLTRDGFALLAMGFTGKEALQWKVKYIQAFNLMEAELTRRNLKEGKAEQLMLFPHLQATVDATRGLINVTAAISILAYFNLNIPPLTREQFKRLIRKGRIEGVKTEHGWQVYQDSFDTWLEQRKRRAA